MLKNILFLVLCFIGFTISAQVINEAWVREHYYKKEYQIPMRDGIKLWTCVYLPKSTSERNPIIMTRTPYSCAPYGDDKFLSRLWQTWKDYTRENYIFVIQDVRGRWMSEGNFVDIRPFIETKKTQTDIDEASDSYDTIDWLVKNLPNNNGNVGVVGASYPGFYSTMAALSNHPALKAVCPQPPETEWFLGDDWHHNGALMMMDAFTFQYYFGKPRLAPTTIAVKRWELPTEDNYKFYLETGALKNLSKLLGDSVKFWTEIMNHPNYDDWWKARDARRVSKNIKPAMLIVGGLFDAEDCYGAWNLYKTIEKQNPATNNKLVMGPWFHGGWSASEGTGLGNIRFGSKTSEYYMQNIEEPFFNYYLKGKGSADKIAEATIFTSGSNEWKTFSQWPPRDVEYKPIYLSANNKLSFELPKERESFSAYISDPAKPVPYTEDIHGPRTREYMTDDQRFAARRPDVLVFDTGVLTEDLTLSGPLTADLKVSVSTTDADFVVKLIDVFPDKFKYDSTYCCDVNKKNYIMDAYQMLVRGEIMRGRFRNSFEKPQAFKPGEITTVKFDLPDVSHTFKKGHHMMVQVQSSWFPLADRNPQQFIDIYHSDDKDFIKSEIKIYHDRLNSSKIVLPVLKGK
jgi:putative CocE/NonD family hydrolase